MSHFSLKAEVRTDNGKEKAKKLRAKGRFPAIVYGAKAEYPVSLDLDIRETDLILTKIQGEKVLVELAYGGKSEKVFVRNVQRDPVKENLLHADFYRVDLQKEMVTLVPVISVGLPAGVKAGGLLEHGLREISVRCLPENVPPHVEVNVENVELGHSLHVREIPAIKGVKILTAPETVLFTVVSKSTTEEPAPAGATAATPAAGAATT